MASTPLAMGQAPELAVPQADELTSPAALKAQAEHAYTESAAYSRSLALLGAPHTSRAQDMVGGHLQFLEYRGGTKDAAPPPSPATPMLASLAGKTSSIGTHGAGQSLQQRHCSSAAGHSSPDGSASSSWPGFLPSLRDTPGTSGGSLSTAHGGSAGSGAAPGPGAAKGDGFAAPPFVHDGSPESDDSVMGGQAAGPLPLAAASAAARSSARSLAAQDDVSGQGLVRVTAHRPFLAKAYAEEAAAAAAAGSAARVVGSSACKGARNDADSADEDPRSHSGAHEGRPTEAQQFHPHLASAPGVRRQLASGFLPRHPAPGQAFPGLLKDPSGGQTGAPLFPRLGGVPGLVGPGLGVRGPGGRRLFVCRFCQRHFSCGRALGGHMKTHRGVDTGSGEGKEADEPEPKSASDSDGPAPEGIAQSGDSLARSPESEPPRLGTGIRDPGSESPASSAQEDLEELSEPRDSGTETAQGYEDHEDLGGDANPRKRDRGAGEGESEGPLGNGQGSKEVRCSPPTSPERGAEEDGEEGEDVAAGEEMGEEMGAAKNEGKEASFAEPGLVLGRGRRQPRPPGRWAGLEGVGDAADGGPRGRSMAPLPLQCKECLRAFESPRALSQHRRFHRPSPWKVASKGKTESGETPRDAGDEEETGGGGKERISDEEGAQLAECEEGRKEDNEKSEQQTSERSSGDDSGDESDEPERVGAAGSDAIQGWGRARREGAGRMPRSRLPPSPRLQLPQPQQQRQQPKLPAKRGPDGGKKERGFECTECDRVFASWKALFGHMRCHPERQWRGIHRPTSVGPTSASRRGSGHADEDEEEDAGNADDSDECRRQRGTPHKAMDEDEDEDTGIAHTSWGRSPGAPGGYPSSSPRNPGSRAKRPSGSPWEDAGEKGGGLRLQQRQHGEGVRVVKRPRTLDSSASRKKMETGAWADGGEQDEEDTVLASRQKLGGWSVRRLKSPREFTAPRGPRHPAGPASRWGREEGLLKTQWSKSLPAAASEEEQLVWDTASCLVFLAASSSSSSAGLDAPLSSLRGPKRGSPGGADDGLKHHVGPAVEASGGWEMSDDEDKGSKEESETEEMGAGGMQEITAKDMYDSDDSSYFEDGPRQDSSSPTPFRVRTLGLPEARSRWALEQDEDDEEDPEEDQEDANLSSARRGDWRRGAREVRRRRGGPHTGRASIWGAYQSAAEGLKDGASDGESDHSASSAGLEGPGAHIEYRDEDAGTEDEEDVGVLGSPRPLAQSFKRSLSWQKGQGGSSGDTHWAPSARAALGRHPVLSRDASLSMTSRSSSNDAAAEVARGGDKGGGKGKYVCSKCFRSFSSYQALGGHRSSHRRGARGSASSPSAEDAAKPSIGFKAGSTPPPASPTAQGGPSQPLASKPSPGAKGPGTPSRAGQLRQAWLSPPSPTSDSALNQAQAKAERSAADAGALPGWGPGSQFPHGLPPRGQRSPRMGPAPRPPVLGLGDAGGRDVWRGPVDAMGPPLGVPGGRRTRRKGQAGKRQSTQGDTSPRRGAGDSHIQRPPQAQMGGSASDDEGRPLEEAFGASPGTSRSPAGIIAPLPPAHSPQRVPHQQHLQYPQHPTHHEHDLSPPILPHPHDKGTASSGSRPPGGTSQVLRMGRQGPGNGGPLLDLNKPSEGVGSPEREAGATASGGPVQFELGQGMVPAVSLTCHDTMSPPSTPSEAAAPDASLFSPHCAPSFMPQSHTTHVWAPFHPDTHRIGMPWAVPAGPAVHHPAALSLNSGHGSGVPVAPVASRMGSGAGLWHAVAASQGATPAAPWPVPGGDWALQGGGAVPKPGPALGETVPMAPASRAGPAGAGTAAAGGTGVAHVGAGPHAASMAAPAGSAGSGEAGAGSGSLAGAPLPAWPM